MASLVFPSPKMIAELDVRLIPAVVQAYPGLLGWRDEWGHTLPEHILLMTTGPSQRYAAVAALMDLYEHEFVVRDSILDDAIRALALAQTHGPYTPSPHHPDDPDSTRPLVSRFVRSLFHTPTLTLRPRLNIMGRVLQLSAQAGGPVHDQLRSELARLAPDLDVAPAKSLAPTPHIIPPQPLRLGRPKSPCERMIVDNEPVKAAAHALRLKLSAAALADMIKRRLAAARRWDRRFRTDNGRGMRMTRGHLRSFLQALAIQAPDNTVVQALLVPGLRMMLETALHDPIGPDSAWSETERLHRQSQMVARHFAPLSPAALGHLHAQPLPYASRHDHAARAVFVAYGAWALSGWLFNPAPQATALSATPGPGWIPPTLEPR